MVKFRPHVILSAATTLDGKIATKSGDSKLSSKKDIIRLHKLRTKVDAILIGKNTVERDDPVLNVRYTKGTNPIRIILDSKGVISSKSKIIKTCKNIPTIIIVSKKALKQNLIRLRKYPLQVLIVGENTVNTKKLLQILWKMKIKKILLEGGGNVNWDFLRQGLVDEVIITITPYLLGGKNAVTLVEGKGFSKITKSTKLKLQKFNQLGNELVVYYSRL